MSMTWPETVYILEPDWAVIDGPPGCDKDNWPRTAEGWANYEFRTQEVVKSNNPASINLMLQIWQYRYNTLWTYQPKYRATYSLYDVYNAAWVACGYEKYQSQSAYDLAQRCFPSTY